MSLPILTPIWLFGWWFLAALLIVPLGMAAFSFNFFRDPDRAAPGDEFTLVSPADGTITDVGSRNEPDYFKAEVQGVGIFLSVFDVHVNRSPLDGTVDFLSHREGKYLDARDPDCSTLNECQNIGAKSKWGPRFYVRQISGMIARNIVCPLQVGSALKRGERFGMIKFGSRTELYLDDAFEVEWKVKKGDKVLGGATVLATLRLKENRGTNA
ncbi:MAG: phosphatidylserine decarboxylase family protein [Planctomycetes bacterium]|nr:phosphatidylserine decarboxylase family protein [Planctomycetota bacterium]